MCIRDRESTVKQDIAGSAPELSTNIRLSKHIRMQLVLDTVSGTLRLGNDIIHIGLYPLVTAWEQ